MNDRSSDTIEQDLIAELQRRATMIEAQPDIDDLSARRGAPPVEVADSEELGALPTHEVFDLGVARRLAPRLTAIAAAAALIVGLALWTQNQDSDQFSLEPTAQDVEPISVWLDSLPDGWSIIEADKSVWPSYPDGVAVAGAVSDEHGVLTAIALREEDARPLERTTKSRTVGGIEVGVIYEGQELSVLQWSHGGYRYWLEHQTFDLERLDGMPDSLVPSMHAAHDETTGAMTNLVIDFPDEFRPIIDDVVTAPNRLTRFRVACPPLDADHQCRLTVIVRSPQWGSQELEKALWWQPPGGQTLRTGYGDVLFGHSESPRQALVALDSGLMFEILPDFGPLGEDSGVSSEGQAGRLAISDIEKMLAGLVEVAPAVFDQRAAALN